MKRYRLFLLIAILCLSFRPAGEDPKEAILQHNIKLFEGVLRTVNAHYVDSLDPAKLTRVAVDAMMHSLDPYSVYFDEKETYEREHNTWRGALYAGIGAGVAPRDSLVIITDPYEGYGAHLAGLRAGDVIHAINEKNVKGLSFDEVVKLLRGDPGTDVEVTVNRPQQGLLKKRITRKQIFTKSILYSGMIDSSTGYINISQFLVNSDTEFRKIVNDLKTAGAKRIILDLRDNIGGLVQEAVNCLSCFLPKGTKVCSLKGIHKGSTYDYFTNFDPVDTLIPIAILTNKVTVSSGEIFTGALQDLDRAVVLGERTFGKGFVQGTRYPGFGTSIYLTAARYYTPSGRCIQEIDYSKRKNEHVVKFSDTLRKEFKTRNGRPVYNIGGVSPDIKTNMFIRTDLITSLATSRVFFDFLTEYRNKHEDTSLNPGFKLNDVLLNLLLTKLDKEDGYSQIHFTAENDLDRFIEKLKSEKLDNSLRKELTALRKKINREKVKVLSDQRQELKLLLETELVRRYNGQSGTFRHKFLTDNEILKALEILKDEKAYRKLLGFN